MQDPNWNVIALADANGDVGQRISYTGYGHPEFRLSNYRPRWNLYAWDILYTGRQYDLETGLYNYRNRFYGAELGRFLSRDPIQDDINLYRYVGNNPVIYGDPSGLACRVFDIHGGGWSQGFSTSILGMSGTGTVTVQQYTGYGSVCDTCCPNGATGKEFKLSVAHQSTPVSTRARHGGGAIPLVARYSPWR